jgi:hypothetical protein
MVNVFVHVLAKPEFTSFGESTSGCPHPWFLFGLKLSMLTLVRPISIEF